MSRDKILQEIVALKKLTQREIARLDLNDIDFSGCNLEQTVFRHCTFRNSSFAGSNLSDVRFEYCLFQNNRFEGAVVQKAHFIKCTGLPAATREHLLREGAYTEKLDRQIHPFLGGAAVLLIAVALFLACGGYKLFLPLPVDETETQVKEATPDDTADLLRRAREQYAAGFFTEAAELYRSLQPRIPNNMSFLIEYAEVCDRAEQYDRVAELVEHLRRESKREDEKLQGEMILAGAMLRQGQMAEGAAAFDRLVQTHAGDLASRQTILRHQGTVLMQSGRHTEAIEAFQRLIDISEPNQIAGVWILVALVHQERGDTEAANEALARAGDDPNAPPAVRTDAQIKRALTGLAKGNYDRVTQEVFETLAGGGDPGQVLSAIRRISEALTAAEHPEKVEPLYRRLLAALENIEAAAARNDARVDLANLLLEKQRLAEALALYRQVAAESLNDIQRDWARDMVEEMTRNESAAAGDR